MTSSQPIHAPLEQEVGPAWQAFRAALAELAAVRVGAPRRSLQRLSPTDLRALAEEFARPTQVLPRS